MPEIPEWARKQLNNGATKQKIKQLLRKQGYGEGVMESIDELESREETEFITQQARKRLIEISAFIIVGIALAAGALLSYHAFKQPTQQEIIANLSQIYGNVIPMRVVGNSMQPFLNDGDIVLVAMDNFSLRQNNVAMITFEISNESVVKRVVSLPNQKISPYESYLSGTLLGKQMTFYNNVVPPENVIVLGDNERDSADSRQYGVVPVGYIKGIVVGE